MKTPIRTHEGRVALVTGLSALFKLVGQGKLKFELTKYPLREAAKVHQLFETRKTSGKIVLVP
jgi:NADPH:quinone reductase-like Zn-dependent oxidoreductase